VLPRDAYSGAALDSLEGRIREFRSRIEGRPCSEPGEFAAGVRRGPGSSSFAGVRTRSTSCRQGRTSPAAPGPAGTDCTDVLL